MKIIQKMKQRTVFMYLSAAIVVTTFLYLTTCYNPTDIQIKVNQVDKIEKMSGNKDGFNTEIYYLVYSDKGTFRINISGLLAYPEFAGKMKKDSIYTIRVCGVELSYLGIYRNVIEVK